MRCRYLDAMALVQWFRKPDLFITMTCNFEWKEIIDELLERQELQDRSDLTSQISFEHMYMLLNFKRDCHTLIFCLSSRMGIK